MDVSENRILSGLPDAERQELLPLFQEKRIHVGEILSDTADPIRAVYFPFDAAISMVNVKSQAPQTVDVALIGREGCYGCSVVLGSDRSPSTFMVEVGGNGVQVETSKLLEALPRLIYLRAAFDRYNYLLTQLIVISVGCSQFHSAPQRLARWLMSHYHRTGITKFPFSHDFLAAQTGLSKTILVNELTEFEKDGLVETGHHTVSIAQPEALEACACPCFQLAKDATDEYLRGLEGIRGPRA
jgi:hypothetical protein